MALGAADVLGAEETLGTEEKDGAVGTFETLGPTLPWMLKGAPLAVGCR